MRYNACMKARVYWTDAELGELRALYEQHRNAYVPLAAWADVHGRSRPNVARKARELGLTDASRPTHPPRQPRVPKWSTEVERRRAIGAATKAYIAEHGHPRGALGLKHSAETKAKVAQVSRRMWELMTPAQRALAAERRNRTNLERYGTGAPVHLNAAQPYSRCRGGRRADLENRYFRSAWEANYARYLNLQVAHGLIQGWEYEPQTFVFHGVTRGALSYTPDFRVTEMDGRQNYREVKGWMTSQSRTRLKRMADFYPEVEIQLVDEPVYKALAKQCAGLIPTWEGR
jgi:hypothetical protein